MWSTSQVEFLNWWKTKHFEKVKKKNICDCISAKYLLSVNQICNWEMFNLITRLFLLKLCEIDRFFPHLSQIFFFFVLFCFVLFEDYNLFYFLIRVTNLRSFQCLSISQTQSEFFVLKFKYLKYTIKNLSKKLNIFIELFLRICIGY